MAQIRNLPSSIQATIETEHLQLLIRGMRLQPQKSKSVDNDTIFLDKKLSYTQ